jgi:hypothetical protein
MKKTASFFSLLLLAFTFVQPSYAHRYFDSWRAQWCTPDPYLMLYPGWSPYNYGLCNPLRNIDPSGDTTYAYNKNHDLVPIDNSPDIISWGTNQLGDALWATGFGRSTEYRYESVVSLREGGTPAWRNNNPGNLMWSTPKYGAIGIFTNKNGNYLIFPSRKRGHEAMYELLTQAKYQNLTLAHAIALYDRGDENANDDNYVNFVSQQSGYNRDMNLSSVGDQGLKSIQAVMERYENSTPGTTTFMIIDW